MADVPADRSTKAASNSPSDLDRRMMKRALALARRGRGHVEPNPMVGCVIVRGGQVIGEGHHRLFGGPHAEIEALRACSTSPRGAMVYVSLEPCCHKGKTPPCTEALIEARVSHVVAAMRDPSRKVGGAGLRRLRAAGIAVETGLLIGEAAEVLAPFIVHTKLGRPYVIAKWAQSIDGKLATHTGDSKWISCEQSRGRVHQLRASVDAILVGAGTVIADDPMLTARDVRVRRRALRVVLDSRLRIPYKCRLVATAGTCPTLLFTSAAKAKSPKARRLAGMGVEVRSCTQRRGRLALNACLDELAKRDVTNLLVEGGPTMLTAFFEAGLIDEALAFISPRLIGGVAAPGVVGGRGVTRIKAAITPRSMRTRRCGIDMLYQMIFTDPLALAGGADR